MPSQWVKLTLIFIIGSGLLVAGLLLNWYPHSVIESKETRLNQGGLTQSEIDNLQGSLPWWRAQGIFYYGLASNFVIASGILVLVYAIVRSVLFTWRASKRNRHINVKKQEASHVKIEENLTDNFQYEKTRKIERINFPIAGGLLTIIASWIAMFFPAFLFFQTKA
jgi:hypothetical protein